MGSGGSVVAKSAAKTVVVAGATTRGSAKLSAGAVGALVTAGKSERSRRLLQEGYYEARACGAELARDGVTLATTAVATVVVASCSGVARAVGDPSMKGICAALGGTLVGAPVAAVSQAVNGGGVGGVLVGTMHAAHGRGGRLHRIATEQLDEILDRKTSVLDAIGELRITESLQTEAFLWQLAELAAAVYCEPVADTGDFRCDLSGVRDPEQDVEAQMAVFIGRSACQDGRDLAVLVLRGTVDSHDGLRNLESIVGFSYPSPIITTAAELVAMYQGQGCDVMVTGHSLGGYMAEVIATTLGLNGVAFCAPGPGAHNGPWTGRLPGFVTINHDADTIGNFSHELHQAPPIYVTDGGLLGMPTGSHRVKSMVDCMHRRADWTNLNALEQCRAESDPVPFHVFGGLRTRR